MKAIKSAILALATSAAPAFAATTVASDWLAGRDYTVTSSDNIGAIYHVTSDGGCWYCVMFQYSNWFVLGDTPLTYSFDVNAGEHIEELILGFGRSYRPDPLQNITLEPYQFHLGYTITSGGNVVAQGIGSNDQAVTLDVSDLNLSTFHVELVADFDPGYGLHIPQGCTNLLTCAVATSGTKMNFSMPSITFVPTSPVPEPSTYALMLTGLLLMTTKRLRPWPPSWFRRTSA